MISNQDIIQKCKEEDFPSDFNNNLITKLEGVGPGRSRRGWLAGLGWSGWARLAGLANMC